MVRSQLRQDLDEAITASGNESFAGLYDRSYNDKHVHVRRLKLCGVHPTPDQIKSIQRRMRRLYPNRNVEVYIGGGNSPWSGNFYCGLCLKIDNEK